MLIDNQGVYHQFQPVLKTKEVHTDRGIIYKIEVDSTATAILKMANEVIKYDGKKNKGGL